MPEGDTIYRAARTLQAALAGQVITRFESRLAPLASLDRREPIAGRTMEGVVSAGKHLLMSLSGGLVLRTHMRMNGSWHIYRPGEDWQRPRRDMRILFETAGWVAVAFNVQEAEFLRVETLAKRSAVARLGPDLLRDFDRERALARVRQQGARPIHEVLLDQRVMAGIGNVYKSELMFLSHLHPDTPADVLDDDAWYALMALAQKLLAANAAATSGQGVDIYRGLRRTTGAMNPADRLWVYGRGGRPCRRCGTAIAGRQDGSTARVTYWCPKCQEGVRQP